MKLFSRRLLPLVAALFLAAAGEAGLSHFNQAQAEERTAPAAKVFVNLDSYFKLSPGQRDKFRPRYTLLAKQGTLEGARLSLVADGQETPLPLSTDGVVQTLPSATQLSKGQVKLAFRDGTKIGVRLELVATLQDSTTYSARDLDAVLQQANAGLRASGGLEAMMAPKLTRLVFEGAQAGEAIEADGDRAPLPMIDGHPAYQPAAKSPAASVQLQRPPSAIVIKSK